MLSAESYGTSAWSLTGRINTVKEDGTPSLFFVKVGKVKTHRMCPVNQLSTISSSML